MMTLRNRLLASYLLMLALTLGVIVATLLVFLSTRPEPNVNVYRRLEALSQGFNEWVGEFSEVGAVADMEQEQAQREQALRDFATDYDVRLMIIVFDRNYIYTDNFIYNDGYVFFDSSNTYQRSEPFQLIVDKNYYEPNFNRRITNLYGTFEDKADTRWYYAGTAINGVFTVRDLSAHNYAIILADNPALRSLQGALADFGAALALPILQSGIIGLVVAFVLAAIMSRTLAKPLQNFARAATAIGRGSYDHPVPVDGPVEVRTAAEAFNRMSTEVQHTQQVQRDFLANVSHDLKTPLTSIQGYSQAIMDGTAKDTAHAAEIIYQEAGRLTRMVSELTDLARLQAGAVTMQTSRLDLSTIVGVVTQRLQVVAERKNIELKADLQPLPLIPGDGDRLAQVITNLVSNAINYTPSGGSVQVGTHPNGTGVLFTVADTGVGIPEDELSRIFERFYQVDKTRGPKRGTGLGLAIAQEIVQAHGGRIWADSAGHGQGSTFTVWLPTAQYPTEEQGSTKRS